MRLWLGFVAVVGGAIFVSSLLDLARGSHLVKGNLWVGLIVPPAMLLLGILLPKCGLWLGKRDERVLLEFLEETLAARAERTV